MTLEQLTSTHPRFGTLITFFQFLVVSLYGLPQHLTWTPSGPRLKPRTVPLTPYLIQVGLFYFISLLNNAAFVYRIPMSVHIIFRSGGLIVSMLLGWILVGKKYTPMQVESVILVTAGVALTTLSASTTGAPTEDSTNAYYTYATGITILSLALVLSGLLGLVQDWTYSTYGRTTTSSKPWRESMFYLHFLSLPLFFFVRGDISSQLRAIHSSLSPRLVFNVPTVYVPLALNTFMQLVCVAGVNRLTTRVSALTVTLVLVVRKATSLVLSVVGDGIVVNFAARAMGDDDRRTKQVEVDERMMWTGAVFVMMGTIGYTIASGRRGGK